MSELINAMDVIHDSASAEDRQRIRVHMNKSSFFARKYLFDLIAGRVLLVVFSPVILVLWAIVKLTSKGPGFYRQSRLGLNGEEFEVIKLRSMRVDAERDGQPVWCTKSDSRITRVGNVLRTLHLDELPQLLNVARGEMSLVGPRPERPMICEELAMEVEGYFDRLKVKPGITGLSQINLPPDTSLADVRRKQVLDLMYINETNLWLEFRILLATALRIIGIKGATAMKIMSLCRRSVLDEMGLSSKAIINGRKDRSDTKRKSHAGTRTNGRVSAEPTPFYSRAYDSDGAIDLDCDSLDSSSSGIGSGIGLPVS